MATKYQPLVDHVAAQGETMVTLSFAEIEAIVGGPLPLIMQLDTSAWNNVDQALVWRLQDLGWRARLDRRNRRVVFAFTREGG